MPARGQGNDRTRFPPLAAYRVIDAVPIIPLRMKHLNLRLVLVMLAWLAQSFMPVVHATVMAESKAGGMAWCGDASSAAAALAILPPEIRAGLAEGGASADHLADCTMLCAVGATGLPPVGLAPTEALRAEVIAPAPVLLNRPATRPQSPTPPAHAPPARG